MRLHGCCKGGAADGGSGVGREVGQSVDGFAQVELAGVGVDLEGEAQGFLLTHQLHRGADRHVGQGEERAEGITSAHEKMAWRPSASR